MSAKTEFYSVKDYSDIDPFTVIPFLVYVMEHNPEIYNEIMCRVAMGVQQWKTTLMVTEPGRERLNSCEEDMRKALLSFQRKGDDHAKRI